MIRAGIIGLGYWGPNLLRIFNANSDIVITAICDKNIDRLKRVSNSYPNVKILVNEQEILNKKMIDIVVISTPTSTHYAIARFAIEKGIHTFVEKPLATSAIECENLIKLSEKFGVVLFVGHLFIYSNAVKKLKELISAGELGNICYISSNRLNLGPIRQDVNVLWDLTPHDISIITHLIGSIPQSINCQGLAYLNDSIYDICSIAMHFDERKLALINASWLDPNKTRLLTVVGDKKMAVYNDMEPIEKIKIFNKRVETPKYAESYADFHFSYRYGDTYCPMIEESEPLKTECDHFIECVKTGNIPLTDGYKGLEVVKILEAADFSLHNKGNRVELEKNRSSSIN